MSDLTPARLRELIAAATPGPWEHLIDTSWTTHDRIIQAPSRVVIRDGNYMRHWKEPMVDEANFDLIVYLVNNASALAEALDEADLLKWLGESILDGWTFEWNPHQGMFEVLNDEGRYVAGSDQWIDALRAAKEASRGK